jgi:hypothetical protein
VTITPLPVWATVRSACPRRRVEVVTVEEAVAFTDDVVAAADQQHRGQLLAAHKGGDRGFTAFALAGVSSLLFIGLAALRGARRTTGGSADRTLVGAH